ncbi:MAG: hypothetical protein M3R17_14175 [Bacteroidota bacterium]|nr:hypothetical protein [Bacteroidota bacterium]
MKTMSFLLVLLLQFTSLFADNSISSVFIHKSGKDNLYVLQLKSGDAYDYMRYTNKRVYHDSGVYTVHHGKIAFESKNHKHGFNSVGGKTYFISDKGIFKTRIKSMLGRESVLDKSEDETYRRSWDFNPLTGKSAADLATEKAEKERVKNEKTLAKKQEELMAFTRSFYIFQAEFYANGYQELLEKNYCGPGCYSTVIDGNSMDWNYDTSRTTLTSDFGTVIHESTHNFNGAKYLVIPGTEIPVNRTRSYASSEFKTIVPSDAAARIFRYNTYVSDSAIVSANTSGIYGLMDEFSAYENGTRADVLAAQTALANGDTALARNFLSQAKGTYFAYYEFNLFIAWYLHYGKTAHADIYKETMANTNLRLTYTLIDQEFKATIAELKKTAAAAGEGKNYLSESESAYAAYPKQLLVKEQPYLTAFAIKGATVANYQKFVK